MANDSTDREDRGARLQRSFTTLEYFTFGFGTMVGVGWLVLMDDWLARGGPAGAMLGFLLGGLLLLPIARTYGRLVQRIPEAGAEIAYTRGLFPPALSFGTGWIMVLAYAIVCPWEAVALGNLLARLWPAFFHRAPLYAVAGKSLYAPRLLSGLLLVGLIAALNYRGNRHSGRFQNLTTFGLLLVFLLLVFLGLFRSDPANLLPPFARPGISGALLSTFLVLQIVPYYMSGFEAVAKGAEEAHPEHAPRGFARAMDLTLGVGAVFYVLIVAVVALLLPWREIVRGRIGTELVFQRAFGSPFLGRLIVFGAFLSLLKVFNGTFVAASRLLFAIGRQGLVHPFLGTVHPRFGTPAGAILFTAAVTALGSFFGDAALVPISEVGSLAVAVGWLAACVAFCLRARREGQRVTAGDLLIGWLGALVSLGLIAIKVAPPVPGSFTRAEWLALGGWLALGTLFWRRRPRGV